MGKGCALGPVQSPIPSPRNEKCLWKVNTKPWRPDTQTWLMSPVVVLTTRAREG